MTFRCPVCGSTERCDCGAVIGLLASDALAQRLMRLIRRHCPNPPPDLAHQLLREARLAIRCRHNDVFDVCPGCPACTPRPDSPPRVLAPARAAAPARPQPRAWSTVGVHTAPLSWPLSITL